MQRGPCGDPPTVGEGLRGLLYLMGGTPLPPFGLYNNIIRPGEEGGHFCDARKSIAVLYQPVRPNQVAAGKQIYIYIHIHNYEST